MRRLEIGGRVVRKDSGRVPRVRVELATVERDELERRSRTDADGRFLFVFRGKLADLAEAELKELSLRVTDDQGRVLTSCALPGPEKTPSRSRLMTKSWKRRTSELPRIVRSCEWTSRRPSMQPWPSSMSTTAPAPRRSCTD